MPIVIKLNGKEMKVVEGTKVGQLLDSRKIRREMVTAKVNSVIIDLNQFDAITLKMATNWSSFTIREAGQG